MSDMCLGGICQPGATSCGNGCLEAGETCDDGNTSSNDGCSATCQPKCPCWDAERLANFNKTYCVAQGAIQGSNSNSLLSFGFKCRNGSLDINYENKTEFDLCVADLASEGCTVTIPYTGP